MLTSKNCPCLKLPASHEVLKNNILEVQKPYAPNIHRHRASMRAAFGNDSLFLLSGPFCRCVRPKQTTMLFYEDVSLCMEESKRAHYQKVHDCWLFLISYGSSDVIIDIMNFVYINTLYNAPLFKTKSVCYPSGCKIGPLF